uniref:Tenascin N n=1 Tax=Jaculus jaculus TaxID=51337 RepID=A0A8C5KMQ1_JACJA
MGLPGKVSFPLGLLLASVLLVSSAPTTPQEPQGCSNKEQQVTVSHTYKIDVPKSALVQVEADPQALSDDGTPLLALGEGGDEQNFIFRHNIRLQTPQKDCDLADSIQDLLARVKKLEEEMAEMKEQCNPQRCCPGAAGEITTWPSSHKHSASICYGVCQEWCPSWSACSSLARIPSMPHSPHLFPLCPVVPPQGLQLLKSTETSLLVSWEPTSEVDHYLLSYYPLGKEPATKQIQVPKEQHTYEIPGLQPGTKYIVTLRNVKKDVSSSPQHLLATTDLAVVGTAWVNEETETSLDVEWENPLTEVDYYKLRYGPLTGHEVAEVTVPKSNDPKSRYDITGLQPGTEYKITVVPMRGDLEGKPILLSGRTEIDGPKNVITDQVTEDTAVVSWDPVKADIDKYVVRYISPDGDTKEKAVPKDESSTILKGLKPGEAYKVYVWAERGSQGSKKADTKALTEIDSPENLVTDRVTENTASVSWNPVEADIDRYVVSYTSADGQTREVPVRKDQHSTVLTGLSPGVEYKVYVWAEKGDRESKKANTKAPTDIDGPKNLVTKQVTETTLTVSWDPVEADIDRYMVRYTSADGETRELPVSKDRSSTVLTGLRPGVEYEVDVWAQKGAQSSRKANTKAPTGNECCNFRMLHISWRALGRTFCFFEVGSYSSSVSGWPQTHSIDSPKNLVAEQVTENTATVSWDPVKADIDRYVVRYTSEDGETREILVGKEERSTTLTGMRPGVEYHFDVWAQKGTQESRKASTKAPTDIDGPKNLVTEQVTETTLTVSWDPVEADIDRYMVRYTSADGETREVPVSKEESSTVLTGLRPGVEYEVDVWAQKGAQSSRKANTKAPTDIDSPKNLEINQATEDTLTISWDPVKADIDRYVVRYTSADGKTKEFLVGKDQRSTVLRGLRPGVEYKVDVWAQKGARESRKASTRAPTDIDSPKNLVTNQVTENTATISWDPVQADIDRYMVRYTSADGETREVPVSKDRSSTVLTGLRPGVEYTVHVWAQKGGRTSKKANTQAPTEIDSPQNLVTNRVTENTATISWDPVRATIDRYMVRYTSADGETREVPVSKDRSSTVLTGLRPGVEYTVHVWAQKGARESKKADTEAVTDIDPPKNFRPFGVTHTGGALTWMPPSAQIDGYILTYQFPNGTVKEVRLQRGEHRFELQGLEQGITYPISLVAYKGDRRSRSVSTTLSTVDARFPHPSDCSQVQQNTDAASGLYTIYLNGDADRPMQVYCDMDTDGGGWIVFQRRNTGQLDFFKRWRSYVEGFGDPMKEFWLGLDKLHNLTSGTPTRYEVRVDLQTANESAYAVYDFFQVASNKERYKLSVGKYRGTAGDALTYHNGWKFTTFDRDNDIALSNCALTHHGGWWYKNCHLANPNGKYGETKHSEGVNWEPWKGHEFSIPYVELKIRPFGYSRDRFSGRKKRSVEGKARVF